MYMPCTCVCTHYARLMTCMVMTWHSNLRLVLRLLTFNMLTTFLRILRCMPFTYMHCLNAYMCACKCYPLLSVYKLTLSFVYVHTYLRHIRQFDSQRVRTLVSNMYTHLVDGSHKARSLILTLTLILCWLLCGRHILHAIYMYVHMYLHC